MGNTGDDSIPGRLDGSDEPLLGDSDAYAAKRPQPRFSNIRSVLIVCGLVGIFFSDSMSNGLVVVGLPDIVSDLNVPNHLQLWPSFASSLANACFLLTAGAVADVLGDRSINIVGTGILSASILGTALSNSASGIIVSRFFQGLGASMSFPTGISIISRFFNPGPQRNIALASLGFAQPLGYSLGLILEGIFASHPGGWRVGFKACAVISFLVTLANFLALPPSHVQADDWRKSLGRKVDWIGALSAGAFMGLTSYICATLTDDISSIKSIHNIILAVIAVLLAPVFIFWMDRQERRGAPALIPNSLWKNRSFLSIIVIVFLAWAGLKGSQLYESLFFQNIQKSSPLEASLKLLPCSVSAVILDVCTGLFVHLVRVDIILIVTSLFASLSPLLLAVADPNWNYWLCAFWSVFLSPVSTDVVFTVANLMITDIFPASTQSLAGAVFNSTAHLGNSVGVCIVALFSAAARRMSDYPMETPESLLLGYRASFWALFGMMVITVVISSIGFRGGAKVGVRTSS